MPYDSFSSELPTNGEELNALMDALRMETKSKAEPAELPSWPFPHSLLRRLRVRGWLLFLSALPFFEAIPYALSMKDEYFKYFIVTQALILGVHILRGLGPARRARYFVQNTIEEAERRAARPSEVFSQPQQVLHL